MTKFGIGQAVRRVEDQRFATGAGQYVGDLVAPPAMLWRGGAFAACACGDQARRRRRGEGGAGRSCRAHRRRCCDRQDRRHSAVLHAGILGRTQRDFRPPVQSCSPIACAASATVSPSSSPRPRRRRAMPPSLSPSIMSRCPRSSISKSATQPQAPKIWHGLSERQYRRDDRVRRQGGDRCRLRRGQARRIGPTGQQSHHRKSDRAALRDRHVRRR